MLLSLLVFAALIFSVITQAIIVYVFGGVIDDNEETLNSYSNTVILMFVSALIPLVLGCYIGVYFIGTTA